MVPAVVRVDVAIFHTSAARVPNVVRDREADDQTLSGIVAARDVDAVNTVASVWVLIVEIAEVIWLVVLALMLAARDVDAASTVAFVFAFTAVFPDVTARARALDALPTTLFVFELTEVLPFVIARARPDDALPTAVLVLELTADVIPEVCVFVFALMLAANDVEAAKTVAFVLAFMFDANEVDAAKTVAFVFAFTAEVIPDVCVFVFAFMLAASEVEAVRIAEFVFALTEVFPLAIARARPDEALPTTVFVFEFTADVIPDV